MRGSIDLGSTSLCLPQLQDMVNVRIKLIFECGLMKQTTSRERSGVRYLKAFMVGIYFRQRVEQGSLLTCREAPLHIPSRRLTSPLSSVHWEMTVYVGVIQQ